MDGGGVLQPSILFFFCLFFLSETSISLKPPEEAIWQNERLPYEDDETIFTSTASETQLDSVPIVNPTTPTTTTPIVNPTSPPAPTPPEPMTNPNPYTNPTPTPTTTTPASSGGGSWCVANPTASSTALQVALDYACGYGGADCSAVQPGGPCFDPSTIKDHASYAFNNYYQKNPLPTSCVFGGAAQLTYTDPSYGSCHFAASNKSPTMTPPTMMPPATPTPTVPMTPPSTTTPVNPYPAGPTGYGSEPTDYGSEPTGTPNSAKMVSHNQQLILVVTCLMVWFTAVN